MAAIRGHGNRSTELTLARILRSNGLVGWRRHAALPGKPDYVFSSEKVVIFLDGCFWHGCPRCYKQPRTNAAFWSEKIRSNRARDRKVCKQLRLVGWAVLRIWEHALTPHNEGSIVRRIERALKR